MEGYTVSFVEYNTENLLSKGRYAEDFLDESGGQERLGGDEDNLIFTLSNLLKIISVT